MRGTYTRYLACYHGSMDPRQLGEVHNPDEETARFARMTPAARLKLFFQLCDLTDALQAGRPNRAALRAPQPRSEEALALWAKLMQAGTRDR